MIKTLEDIEKQYNQVIEKHPNLENVLIKSYNELPEDHELKSFKGLAKFIDNAWKHTYNEDERPKSRFIYTPNYLEWLLDDIDQENIFIAIDQNNNILGLNYGISKKLKKENRFVKTIIYTGLSVNPLYTKKGVAQNLHLSFQKQVYNKGYEGTIIWFDGKKNQKGNSLEIFKRKDKFLKMQEGNIYGIVFNDSILNVNYFNPIQKRIIKSLIKVPYYYKNKNSETNLMKEDYLEDVLNLINNRNKKITHFYYTVDEAKRLLLYKSSNYSKENPLLKTTSTVLKSKNKIKGVLYGYNIPVEELSRGEIFLIDNIVFNKDTSLKEKWNFINNSLNLIYENNNVYSTIFVDNTFNIGLIKHLRFAPGLTQQIIPKKQKLYRALLSFSEQFEEMTQNLNKVYVDHK